MAVPQKFVQPVDREVGSRVRMRRKMLGMSQSALGKLVGVTFQQVQKYEKGANRIGGSRLQQIATALDTTVSSLFGDVVPSDMVPTDGSGVPDFQISKDTIDLNKAYLRITDPKKRSVILSFVEGLAGD